ncbi:sporulation protein [Allostreptomyces psammosilenae]|uniref:Sporulation-control protein n=1 Tax=Allostreptomyces psammosilenae TaxID=1892865 RepID=A0A852ZXI7_9ACTN|nr:sporulation protein [Allostreptomyces psammosilenae]NYI03351.1 sporulation-control protein [Allostreptomyces psammosilenae]
MPFKKLLASLGSGGASVDTVLANPNVYPGGVLEGEVRLEGGTVDQEIESLSLALQALVEVETEEGEYRENVEFHTEVVAGSTTVAAGARHTVPFSLQVPWETPITSVFGQTLTGMQLGVKTTLAIARAVDSGDVDPVAVHALPSQQAVLDGFSRLGFGFRSADCERGHIRGTQQRLPFYQEIEFGVPERWRRALNQVEVSFVAGPGELEVVLEMDKRGGLFTEGSDTYRLFRVDHATAEQTDWADYLTQWFDEVGRKRGWA